jgi:DNA-binding XRE family transcriptional regulator
MTSIRALRQERGWTQFELALAIGVQPHTVYLWESGRRTPQVAQLRKLGAVFGRCSDEIVLMSIPGGRRSPQSTRTSRQPAEPVARQEPDQRTPAQTDSELVVGRDDP